MKTPVFIKNHDLFEDYLEHSYREYLETEREALIDCLKTSIAIIHVEPPGSEQVYGAYEELLTQLDRLKLVDKELLHLGYYWDSNPDMEQPQPMNPGNPAPQATVEKAREIDLKESETPNPYPSEAEAEALAIEEREGPKDYLVPDEEHLEPAEPEWDQEAEENEEKDTYESRTDPEPLEETETETKDNEKQSTQDKCPVCGAPGYKRAQGCGECGFDEAEGIECPKGLRWPLEKEDTVCRKCVLYKRKWGEYPSECNWSQWILEPEAFKPLHEMEAPAE